MPFVIMSFNALSRHKLLQQTTFFGIKLWITIVIGTIFLLLLCLSVSLYFIIRRRQMNKTMKSRSSTSMNRRLLSKNGWDVEIGQENLMIVPDCYVSSTKLSGRIGDGTSVELGIRQMNSCREYTVKEIEEATNGFGARNLTGSGDYGVVYHGIMLDNTHIAVKKLLVNRGRLRDFKGDVEAMWCIRHKNLVKLLGFCTQGTYRMLVFEYVDNGNLQQWLHESICKVTPLTWNIRMNIIRGIAKGLAYLHEDSEPGIIHQHIKSSNVLLDKQWNPKISNYGISSILGPEMSHPMTPPIGMSGYLEDRDLVDVKSDVYSFGILVMEIVSGNRSVSIQQSTDEKKESLIDWVKLMVSEQNFEGIVDPKLHQMPPPNELKRIILIALRCVDSDASNRPKMSDIIHMLEPRDLLLSDEQVVRKVTSRRCSFGDLSVILDSFTNQSNNVDNLIEEVTDSNKDRQKNSNSLDET